MADSAKPTQSQPHTDVQSVADVVPESGRGTRSNSSSTFFRKASSLFGGLLNKPRPPSARSAAHTGDVTAAVLVEHPKEAASAASAAAATGDDTDTLSSTADTGPQLATVVSSATVTLSSIWNKAAHFVEAKVQEHQRRRGDIQQQARTENSHGTFSASPPHARQFQELMSHQRATYVPPPADATPTQRTFWLMQNLQRTMTDKSGAFLSPALYVPRAVWFQPNAKIVSFSAKMDVCLRLVVLLRRLASSFKRDAHPQSASPDAKALQQRMVAFLEECRSLQNTLAFSVACVEEWEETDRRQHEALERYLQDKHLSSPGTSRSSKHSPSSPKSAVLQSSMDSVDSPRTDSDGFLHVGSGRPDLPVGSESPSVPPPHTHTRMTRMGRPLIMAQLDIASPVPSPSPPTVGLQALDIEHAGATISASAPVSPQGRRVRHAPPRMGSARILDSRAKASSRRSSRRSATRSPDDFHSNGDAPSGGLESRFYEFTDRVKSFGYSVAKGAARLSKEVLPHKLSMVEAKQYVAVLKEILQSRTLFANLARRNHSNPHMLSLIHRAVCFERTTVVAFVLADVVALVRQHHKFVRGDLTATASTV